jgi:hypothetical protein
MRKTLRVSHVRGYESLFFVIFIETLIFSPDSRGQFLSTDAMDRLFPADEDSIAAQEVFEEDKKTKLLINYVAHLFLCRFSVLCFTNNYVVSVLFHPSVKPASENALLCVKHLRNLLEYQIFTIHTN